MFSRFKSLLFLSVVSLVLLSSQARSEEVVITATPLNDTSSQSIAGKSPTSFTDTVKVCPLAYGLTDTRDALRLAVDVDLPDYGQPYFPSAPSLRGAKDQQTLIMLDGVPLTASLGDPVDLSLFTIPEIDRIEIVKGSNSAVYGGSAMGGVINIVTRNPGMKDRAEIISSLGTYGYSLYNLYLNTRIKDVGFMLDATRSRADNDYLYEREDGTTVRRENNDFHRTTLLSKLWFDIAGWDTTLSGNAAGVKMGSSGGEGYGGMFLTPHDRDKTNQYILSLNTAKELGSGRNVLVRASRLNNRSDFFADATASDSRTNLTSDYLEATLTQKAGILDLSPGGAWRKEGLSSDQYGIHTRSTGSGFLNTAANLDPVLLSLAGRYDRTSSFDGSWSYHGGILWKVIPHLSLKANAGTGYHVPTMGNLYSPSTSYFAFIHNPDLKPEKSFSWDAGPALEYASFGMGVSWFVTTYRNLITSESDYTAGTLTYVNLDRAHAAGIEAYSWVKPVEPVRISANYAFNRFKYGSGDFESKDLIDKPEQVLTLQADYLPIISGRQADVFASYQFREGAFADKANTKKTGNRNILDAGVSIEVVKQATAAFKVSNILDDRSVEYQADDYWLPVPGRTYQGSIRLSF